LKILVTHPKHWADPAMWPEGAEVRHVSIGGERPTRITGQPTEDGIGEVIVSEGFKQLRDTFRQWRPDVFLFGIHIGFERDHLKELRTANHGTKYVMHYTDQRPTISTFVRRHMGFLDMLLVTNQDRKDHNMYLHSRPDPIKVVRTFYDGVDPAEYWPMPMVPKYDCFFGGNNFWQLKKTMEERGNTSAPWIAKFTGANFREDFLRAVHEKFNLIIRGEWGWDAKVFPNFNIQPPAFHPRYLPLMREAKIVLSTCNAPRYGLVTRRTFRSVASGRLLVTEYSPGLEDHFRNHYHLVWFESLEEGLDVIRFYLDHPEARERIARQGRQFVVENHTFRHRLHEFVELVRRTLF
jgi:hypothetical protein